MDIQRIIKLFTKTQDYWSEVVSEPGDIKSLLVPQMMFLAAVPAVSTFLGQLFSIMRFGFVRGLIGGLVALLLSYVLHIGIWIALGYIIDGLAGSFGARRDIGQSMKLAAGTIIPMWLGGVLNIVPLPGLGVVGVLAGLGFGGYALFLGLPILNGTPQEKAVVYTIASVAILFVVAMVATLLVGCPAACMIAAATVSGLR